MREYSELLYEFQNIAENPKEQYRSFLAAGKKVVGYMPYFCPEELIYASGMTPFGLWSADVELSESGHYLPAAICSTPHTALELAIRGEYKGMTAVMIPEICDNLKCMGTIWRRAVPGIPVISFEPAQNRKTETGIEFSASQYRGVVDELARHGGTPASDEDISDAVELINKRRTALRVFLLLASEHPEVITPRRRSDVIKSSFYMEAGPFIALITELSGAIKGLPDTKWVGRRVVTTGIHADDPELLDIFEKNNIMIAGDQVLYESLSFRDNVVVMEDPVIGLAHRFTSIGGTSVLNDPGKQRANDLLKLVEKTSADGVFFILSKSCDPEEYDYVPVKHILEENDVRCLLIEIDSGTAAAEQARSAVEAFAGLVQ